MPKPGTPFLAPSAPDPVRYQDTIGSPSRSDKTAQRILSQSTRVYVLRDKLDESTAKQLELLGQQLGAQITSTPDAANVIVTVLKAPKRIVKHFKDEDVNVLPRRVEEEAKKEGGEDADRPLGEGVGRDWRRFVVTPEWLDAVKAAGTLVDPDEYAAVALKEEYFDRPPKTEDSTLIGDRKRKRSPSDSPLLPTHHDSKPLRPPTPSPSPTPKPPPSPSQHLLTPLPHPPGVPRYQNTRYACRRPSPLICPNQPLVLELETIRNERRLTGDTYSEMAYMRAISALKAFPFHIPSPFLDGSSFDAGLLELRLGEVEKLKGVGKKVLSLIKQYYSRGEIVESKVIKRDRAVYVMTAFTELYGIGPIGAREAYNSGARSFADVLNRGKSLATHLTAKESVRILGDLRKPIPRQECREITDDIMKLVRAVLPAEVEVNWEICGGYRRGKERTYDLDVIIGHGEPPSRALHMRLLDEMKKKGLITHIVNVSTPAPSYLDAGPTSASTTAKEEEGRIHIDIANIVVLPPLTPHNPTPIHRRVDLVFCPLRVYGATVVGWSGSMTFERDLRLWAKSKGYNFSFDGLTNLAEESVVETRDEQVIFDVLGLEYMPPEWRNCDA